MRKTYFGKPVPMVPHEMDQITKGDIIGLSAIATNARVVFDIGTFLGCSAETLAEAMHPEGVLFTVDTFQGSGEITTQLPEKIVTSYAASRLNRFGDRVTIFKEDSRRVAANVMDGSADLVFIDASHDYENVKLDIEVWLPKVRRGGVLAGHDFDQAYYGKITDEEMKEKSLLEWDSETGVHWGVIRAVTERFNDVKLIKDSSIWYVSVENAEIMER